MKKLVLLFFLFFSQKCTLISAQSFDLLLEDISRTVQSIGKTEFNIVPVKKVIIGQELSLPAGNYSITVEIADPHIAQLKPLIDQIQDKNIETVSVPSLLEIYKGSSTQKELLNALRSIATSLKSSPIPYKLGLGSSNDLFLFYKTPLNPVMDEFLLATSRDSDSGDEGDLERFLATKSALKEQIEQWNRLPSNPKFYVTLRAPDKSTREFELNLASDDLMQYVYDDLLGTPAIPADGKEIEID